MSKTKKLQNGSYKASSDIRNQRKKKCSIKQNKQMVKKKNFKLTKFTTNKKINNTEENTIRNPRKYNSKNSNSLEYLSRPIRWKDFQENAILTKKNKKKRPNFMKSSVENSALDNRTAIEIDSPVKSTQIEHFQKIGSSTQKMLKTIENMSIKDTTDAMPVENTSSSVPRFLTVAKTKKAHSPSQDVSYTESVIELFNNNEDDNRSTFNTISDNSLGALKIIEVPDSENDDSGTVHSVSSDDDLVYEGTYEDGGSVVESVEEINRTEINNPILTAVDDHCQDSVFRVYDIVDFSILHVKSMSRVYFCGKLKASLIFGNAEVLGHVLNYKPCEIYSVVTSNFLCFETTSVRNERTENLKNTLQQLGTPSNKIDEILGCFHKEDTLILLQPHSDMMTRFISKHITSYDMFTSPTISNRNEFYSPLLKCTFYAGDYSNVFVKHILWDTIVDYINSSIKRTDAKCVAMLCGGKNAGKSTTVRYITNKLLQHGPVLILDLDPGQSEFSICGSVSAVLVKDPIIGPNFTHLKKPEKSYAIGMINVVENIDRYAKAVSILLDFVRRSGKYKSMPWVVNTMGFVKALGLNLLLKVFSICRPDVVLELRDKNNKKNFEILLTPKNVNDELAKFSPFSQEPNDGIDNYRYFTCRTYTATDRHLKRLSTVRRNEANVERALNALAYFSTMANPSSLSLLDVKPKMISITDITLMMNENKTEEKYIYNILNGRIVVLCTKRNSSTNRSSINIIKMNINPIECFGFGLIRGVDPEKGHLYILTPLTIRQLDKIDVLLYVGSLPDCSSILSIPHVKQNTMIPYTVPMSNTGDFGNLLQVPKRTYNSYRLATLKKSTK